MESERPLYLEAGQQDWPLFLSSISIGELRRGVDLIRHRGVPVQRAGHIAARIHP
jgi:hypothetical protein